MKRVTEAEALAHLDKRMMDNFGVGFREYDAGTAMHLVPKAYLTAAIRITDSSGIVELLTGWDREKRKSHAGKKALIPLRALVILYLLNMQMGQGITYSSLARTLDYSFTADHFTQLGISTGRDGHHPWYSRVSEATYRLLKLMNPYQTPLHKILKAEAFEDLLERMSVPSAMKLRERNQDRMDRFCNLLVEASLRCLPKDIWERYHGNIAIDATKADIRGGRNSSSQVGSRGNPDPIAGRYRREGNHDGQGKKTDVASYELETAVMIWNKPGENTAFPSLVSTISCHLPGKLVGHAAQLMRRHQQLGFGRFKCVVDRAYNGGTIETFHLPAAHLGVDLVFDYKKTELGVQSHFENLILVDGTWYVNCMPRGLIDASKEYLRAEAEMETAENLLWVADHSPANQRATEVERKAAARAELRAERVVNAFKESRPTLDQRLAGREPYRMIPKGLRDKDGYQRFSYPPIAKMLAKPSEPFSKRTITVPSTLPFNETVASGSALARKSRAQQSSLPNAKMQPIKFWQCFPYKRPDWDGHYGMRNLVESSNALLKSAPHGDINNKAKRSGRGYAATFLALTFAVVASNLRRIATFFKDEALRIQELSDTTRARRRKNELGQPLARPEPPAPPGTSA